MFLSVMVTIIIIFTPNKHLQSRMYFSLLLAIQRVLRSYLQTDPSGLFQAVNHCNSRNFCDGVLYFFEAN